MTEHDDRNERGRAMYEEVNRMAPPPSTSPFMEATVDYVFGEVWDRPGLTRKERRWIALTAVASSGSLAAMQIHVRTALESGDISLEEMREFVLQLALYQGWPKAATLHIVVEEAGARASS